MKAFAMTAFGGNEVMTEIDIPIPDPADNEIQIRVLYAGINPVDWKTREGYLKDLFPHKFPLILGRDAAGIVTKVGKSARKFMIGDKVYGHVNKNDSSWGSFADYITLNESIVAPIPQNISIAQAASLPLAGLTAWQALFDHIQLKHQHHLLVQGAAGGVGGMAVQLARQRQVTISATAKSDNQDYLRSLGVDFPLDYEKDMYNQQIQQQMDVVLDCIGGNSLKKSLQLVKPNGIVVTTVPNMTDEIRKQAIEKQVLLQFIVTVTNGEQLLKMSSLVEDGSLKPLPIQEYDFAHIPQALALSQSGHTKGKIVIKIQENTLSC